MTQPLNYSVKASADLISAPAPGAPLTRSAMRYLADKLKSAEVFQLPDGGQLLDREKTPPEVPGLMFRPPFPVIACEYPVARPHRIDHYYTVASSSRRIALAWDWNPDDLPAHLKRVPGILALPPGVCVTSIFYLDSAKLWGCAAGAVHMAYDGAWLDVAEHLPRSRFMSTMLANGRLAKDIMKGRGMESTFLPLCPEYLMAYRASEASMAGAVDTARADINDEAVAYTDLCYALACKNVSTERISASATLNISRARSGKPPFKDFHILKVGGDACASNSLGTGEGAGPRTHLRRGHIRRLGEGRLTWVSQTMVHGRKDFVRKAYAVGGTK